MNNTESLTKRKEDRYERRQEKRQNAIKQRSEEVGTIEDVFTFYNVFMNGKKCCRGVRWKDSVILFESYLVTISAALKKEVIEGEWEPSPYNHFPINERGKVREIDAPYIRDRVVHKILTKDILYPLYMPYIIFNNGASLPNKGFAFSQRQLKRDLWKHYDKYGRAGWIIMVDMSQFFPSASHDIIKATHERLVLDEQIKAYLDIITDSTPGDYGLPLGVEVSQLEMIMYPYKLDAYVKSQLSIKGYGHYMDDFYIIVPPDRDPYEIYEAVMKKATECGMTVNPKKSHIKKLTSKFTFCKTEFRLLEDGRIITHGNKRSFKHAWNTIIKMHEKLEAGECTYVQVYQSIQSSLAYFEQFTDHERVLKLRRLFYSLFGFGCEDYKEFYKRDVESGAIKRPTLPDPDPDICYDFRMRLEQILYGKQKGDVDKVKASSTQS